MMICIFWNRRDRLSCRRSHDVMLIWIIYKIGPSEKNKGFFVVGGE